MALRVLLADESSTIKKVMQLALQDYAVEVKSVPVGIDVLPVTKIFKPDIIFADVLLTKKTGYEVCQDIKNDQETEKIPVVLMWSGFIDFDVTKATEAKADRSLEKPFDAELLRRLVQDLVPKTTDNPLHQYLDFPPMPDFNEGLGNSKAKSSEPLSASKEPLPLSDESNFFDGLEKSISQNPKEDSPLATEMISVENTPHESPEMMDFNFSIPTPSAHKTDSLNLDEIPIDYSESSPLPESEDFFQVPLSPAQLKEHTSFEASLDEPKEEADEWAQKELRGITIPEPDIPKSTQSASSTQEDSPSDETEISEFSKAHINIQGDFAEVRFDNIKEAQSAPPAQTQLSSSQMEKIVREEARKVIEKICWQILPDIAERLVKKELEKLMKDSEGLPL